MHHYPKHVIKIDFDFHRISEFAHLFTLLTSASENDWNIGHFIVQNHNIETAFNPNIDKVTSLLLTEEEVSTQITNMPN